MEIEFLTDSATRNDKNKNVVISGVSAQPLSYLTLSLETTMEFTTNSGERGFVVSPGAWMFHKGLTFPKRKSSTKVLKDLYGIWYVSSQLGSFSETAVSELHALGRLHTKWYKTFQHNLLTWLENSSQLESQDPFGKLKRLSFEKTLNRLIID